MNNKTEYFLRGKCIHTVEGLTLDQAEQVRDDMLGKKIKLDHMVHIFGNGLTVQWFAPNVKSATNWRKKIRAIV